MHATSCGILDERGRDCPRPVVTGSPLNICAKHLRQAAELYASASGHEPETRVRERCPTCRQMALVAKAAPPTIVCVNCGYARTITVSDLPTRNPSQIESGDPVVYYIQFGDRIKIGTTRNLEARLAALPHDEVLAVERGDRDIEKRRHLQFAESRVTPRGEWFTRGERLMKHIASLQDTQTVTFGRCNAPGATLAP